MKSDILVSVVIPVYNAGDSLDRAIESVLAQTYPAAEIIVVNDGSTDDTEAVAKRYEGKIQYLYQNNSGASVARNLGINTARYEWIGFLDSDDEWLPTKLERQVALIKRDQDLVWVGANFYCYSGLTGRRHPRSDIAKARKFMGKQDHFNDFFDACYRETWGWTGTLMIRRDVLRDVGLFDESIRCGEDLDLWWRIGHKWPKFGYVADPLAVYHVEVQNSLTSGHKPASVSSNLVGRHLKLAGEHGRLKAFRRVGGKHLRVIIRSMLFEKRRGDIRLLIHQFRELFPLYYRSWIYLLTAFPGLTARLCHGISRFIRKFNLRRRVVPHPKRPTE